MQNVNDGSQSAPRLVVYGNEWGLLELPKRPSTTTWSLEHCLDLLVEKGFDGFQGDASRAKLVRAHGLRFAQHARVNTPAEVMEAVRSAAHHGADCLTVHAGWGMESDEEMDQLADAIALAGEQFQVPTYVEIHRATITQDIWRTCRLIERKPGLRFNGDFSHYYCGHELTYRGFDIAIQYLTPIIERVNFMHGRISNGESMQIHVVPGDSHVNNFCHLWREVFRCWRARAQAGDSFPFVPELGPPSSGYSIVDLVGNEISDRWEQTCLLKRLAEECYAAV